MRGHRVLNYVLEQPLGQGGFGSVWTARHQLTDELVAAKVLSRIPGAVTLDALRSEALVLHRLDRAWREAGRPGPPPFVRFVDVGELAGQAVILTEMLRGRDLRGALDADKRPWPVASAGALLAALLEGLAFAHEQSVVHRDIKPENLFLVPDPAEPGVRLRVLDLGIAKVQQDRPAAHTRVMGSVRYMAPERFDGRTSPRVDLYAAGLVAWELLAGRPACPSNEPTVAMQWHRMTGAPPIREVRPDVPADLAAVVDGLTALGPGARTSSAAAALGGLTAWRPQPGAPFAVPVRVDPPDLETGRVEPVAGPRGSPTFVPTTGSLHAPSAPTVDPGPPPAPPASPAAPSGRNMTNLLLAGILVVLTLGCAGTVGITFFSYGLSAVMMRQGTQASDEARRDASHQIIDGFADGIGEWTKAMGRPPKDLSEMGLEGSEDAWGHPIQYKLKGKRWTVTSLGKDGRRGGRGLNKDYSKGGRAR